MTVLGNYEVNYDTGKQTTNQWDFILNTPAGVYKVTATLIFSPTLFGSFNLFPPILKHNLASRPLKKGEFCQGNITK